MYEIKEELEIKNTRTLAITFTYAVTFTGVISLYGFELLSSILSFQPEGFLFILFYLIYLFMAVLRLRFCARAFSSCGKWGPLFIAVRGPLTIAASLVAEHTLQTRRLSNCGSRA